MSETCQGWCGLCYENVRGRSSHKHHRGYRPPRRQKPERMHVFTLTKRTPPPDKLGGIVAGGGGPDDRWPALSEMVCASRWPDGTARLTSSVSLFVFDGVVKGVLNDKDSGLAAWVSGDALESVLDALERGLQEDSLDWRRDGKRTKRGK
jgi:hypothetical protein